MLKYKIKNGDATITDCDASASGELIIPATIEGKPVTRIGSWAFACCDSLKSVKIPDGVTTIGLGAFDGCTSLTSVTIPDSVTSIGSGAFYYCSALADVYYGGTKNGWNSLAKDNEDNANAHLTNANIHFQIEKIAEPETLILCKALADFGEALKKDCPNNDCIIYRNIYERYREEYMDYKRLKEAFADLSGATVRVLEHAIRASEKELYAMWFDNYAVLKQRAALGMAYRDVKPEQTTQN